MNLIMEAKQTPTLIIGDSPQAEHMRAFAKRLGGEDLTVLIQGETGTGKEVMAKEIHKHRQQGGPFVPVNCSAVTETLFESELFGHRKGSFTGAIEDRQGFFESAGDGTIFLDEVGTLPLALQVKLLRVLQDKTFSPVGDRRQVEMRARVVVATNIDLRDAVSRREFREDLFYRLNVIPFVVPPLRERASDIPVLADHFLSQRYRKSKKFTPEAMSAMMCHCWPGNVRELENAVIRSAFLSTREEIGVEHISSCLESQSVKEKVVVSLEKDEEVKEVRQQTSPFLNSDGKFLMVEDLHERYLREVLVCVRGNITKATKIMGISCHTVRNWAEKFGLKHLCRKTRSVKTMFTE